MLSVGQRRSKEPSAVVVGAGPGGISAVSALVHRGVSVSWVDPKFRVGALARYGDVPANTKVELLTDHLPQAFFGALPSSARSAIARMQQNIIVPYEGNPDPTQGWVKLSGPRAVYEAVTEELLLAVTAVHGHARSVRSSGAEWAVDVGGEELRGSVVLATGTRETDVPKIWADLSPRRIPLRRALTDLRACVGKSERVAVVGGGHSGVLLASQLHDLGMHCRLFLRRPLRLAHWDSAQNAYTSWAFRGLKGVAADFAVRHGLIGIDPPNAEVIPGLELLHTDELARCPDVDAVVFCLGEQPVIPPITGSCDVHAQNGLLADGLYGIGIAFADMEFTSGAPYPAAGFLPYARRASLIADEIVRRIRE